MTCIEKGQKVSFSACMLYTDRGPKVYNSHEWQINVSSENKSVQIATFTAFYCYLQSQWTEDILTNQLVSLVIERLGSPALYAAWFYMISF